MSNKVPSGRESGSGYMGYMDVGAALDTAPTQDPHAPHPHQHSPQSVFEAPIWEWPGPGVVPVPVAVAVEGGV